jgi:hypothetical protein
MRKNNPQAKSSAARLRCGIYTRKSTEEGLEQDFNSLDAQREAAEAFIQSQRREGWIALPERYDDGGFTGANMDRPALQRPGAGESWECDRRTGESPPVHLLLPGGSRRRRPSVPFMVGVVEGLYQIIESGNASCS